MHPDKVGGLLQWGIHRGSMVPGRVSLARKLPGTFSWGICCEDLCERQSTNVSSVINEQHLSCPLRQQDGRHKIPSSGPLGNRSVGVVSAAQYSHRVLNIQANRESRVLLDHHDWKLDPSIFTQLNQVWGPIEVDLFATRLSTQLPRFYSWRPDPQSEVIDAFSQERSLVRDMHSLPLLWLAGASKRY